MADPVTLDTQPSTHLELASFDFPDANAAGESGRSSSACLSGRTTLREKGHIAIEGDGAKGEEGLRKAVWRVGRREGWQEAEKGPAPSGRLFRILAEDGPRAIGDM